jgi:C4-dicarboxylate transporter DctM subunit
MVCIIVSCFFAAISGSGPATVAALGMVIIPAMVRVGYKPAFAAALMASGGAIGGVIPPAITFVVYGSISNASIAQLFVSGSVPGILMGVALVVAANIATRRENLEILPKATGKERLKVLKEAFWGLMMPVIILGGIYGGIFTPTEAAAVSVVYGLVVGIFVYHSLDRKTFLKILRDTAAQTGVVMFIIATASLFAWSITVDGTAKTRSGFISAVSGGNTIVFFLILNVVLIFAGCVIDATSAFFILTPIFLPVATQLGIDPVHLGCVMVLNLAIGLVTPPVGVNLYVACGLGHVSLKEISKSVVPFVVASITVLLLVTYIPAISMFLPSRM